MKTIQLTQAGSVQNLTYTDIQKPTVKANEVLIKANALSINPVDYKARSFDGVISFLFGDTRPVTLGWDLSGEIVELGSDVKDFKVGDKVFGMVNFPGNGATYAEYVAAPATHVALKPESISHNDAAAATLAALTAWQILKDVVKKGDRVLIQGASGGVGHYAIQIAKYLGAYVIGVSSSKNKNLVLELGADEHIDYRTEDFETSVADVDFVLDVMGGDIVGKSLNVIKNGGAIVSIASSNFSDENTTKAESKKINLSSLLVQSSGEDMKQIADLMDKGIIRSHVSKIYSFDQMAEAHTQLETGHTVGKVVVTLN